MRKTIAAILGSSPLARGLLQKPPVEGPHLGIIPARAGFTGGRGP